ncbi:MAG: hypothetical protein IAE89_13990 [Anaerolineae bacterium]|nr:hypothetical protein [Anaerolineae bacterium]
MGSKQGASLSRFEKSAINVHSRENIIIRFWSASPGKVWTSWRLLIFALTSGMWLFALAFPKSLNIFLYLIAAALVISVARLRTLRHPLPKNKIYDVVTILCVIIAVVLLMFVLLLSNSDFSLVLIMTNIVMFTFAVVLISHFDTKTTNSTSRGISLFILILCLMLGLVLFTVFFTASYLPAAQLGGDEAGWTNYALTYLREGQIYYQFMGAQPIPVTPGVGYWVVLYAAWLQRFGVSESSGRLFIFVVYLLGVGAVGIASWRIFSSKRHNNNNEIGKLAGVIAALIMASSLLVHEFRLVRPEIALIIPGAFILCLYFAETRSKWSRFIVGLGMGGLAGISLEIHAAGITWIITVAVILTWDMLSQWRKHSPFLDMRFLGAAIGGVGVAILYVNLHILILPDPGYFFSNLNQGRGFLTRIFDLSQLLETLIRYSLYAPFELIAAGMGILGLVVRNTLLDRQLLRFFAVTGISYYVFVPDASKYFVVFTPLIVLSLTSLIIYGFQGGGDQVRFSISTRGQQARIMALIALVAPLAIHLVPVISLENPYPPHQVGSKDEVLRTFSDSDTVIVGDIDSYWSFTDYPNFYSIMAEIEAPKSIENINTHPYGIWDLIEPDVVVQTNPPIFVQIVPHLSRYLVDMNYQQIAVIIDEHGIESNVYLRPGYSPSSTIPTQNLHLLGI